MKNGIKLFFVLFSLWGVPAFADQKISSFPSASSPMGAGDTVTGLQSGANVNFSQSQITTVYQVTRTLTNSELLNLNTTPITIIAAPGANKVISVRNFFYYMHFGTVEYSDSGDAGVYYGAPSVSAIQVDGGQVGYCAEAEADFYAEGTPSYGLPSLGQYSWTIRGTSTLFVNQPLVAGDDQGALTDGDGTLTMTIYYVINDISP